MIHQNLRKTLKTAFQNTGGHNAPYQSEGHAFLQRPEPFFFIIIHTDISDIVPIFHDRELHQGSRFSQLLAFRDDRIQNLQFADPVAGQHLPVPKKLQIPFCNEARYRL